MSILHSAMDTLFLIIIAVVVAVVLLLVLLRLFLAKDLRQMVLEVFSINAESISKQTKTILDGEKDTITAVLEQKQQVMEKMLAQLQKDMATRQQELRLFEEERIKSFSVMSENLIQQQKITGELHTTTQQLSQVLSNNQARGEWGERIIEDLLVANGLVEHVHYRRQTKLGDSMLKPDIMLLLPNKKIVPIDVKFPYMAMQKMLQASSKEGKREQAKIFLQDIQKKVDKVAEYIQPENGTLDYAVLFVPNEMIFSFINQNYPQIVDQAIAKRVLLVSPFTFLIVARTVMESYRNFVLSDSLQEIYKHVMAFTKEWGLFQAQFAKYGRTLDALQNDYQTLMQTRVSQMEKRITAVKTIQDGVSTNGQVFSEKL